MKFDSLGNSTEEAVIDFLSILDKNKALGPKPISGVSFTDLSIAETLDCDADIAMRLFTEPSIFKYDEFDQVYVEIEDENGGEMMKLYIVSDKFDPSFDLACEVIGERLIDVPYDIECGGYPSRQSEAASLYKIAIVNSLQEDNYKDDIMKALDGYDFNRWIGKDGNYVFTNLLQKVQEEADSVSRIILMCANNKLIADRIKKDTSYKGILKEEDAEKLNLLAKRDSSINSEFNQLYEKASNTKEKILIGEKLAEERAKNLSQPFCTNDIKVLFAIYSLNQNAIPGRAKRIIRNAANLYIDELCAKEYIKDKDSTSEFKKKLISRAQKLYLSRMKQIRYKLWRDRTPDTDLSSLIPKY